MKQTIRAFALGIICATALLTIIFYLETSNSTNNQTALTSEELIKQLEEKGYYVSQEAPQEQDEPPTDTEEGSTPENTQVEENIDDETEIAEIAEENSEIEQEITNEINAPTSFTLNIQSGMTDVTISNTLENAGIIEDAEEFVDFLRENDYSVKIQVGQFTVTDAMTQEEIATTIINISNSN